MARALLSKHRASLPAPADMNSAIFAPIILIPAAFLLASCDAVLKPEVAACETFVQAKIATPSSLQTISSRVYITDGAEIDGLTAADTVRVVSLEYDAANQYGALERGSEQCAFRLEKGGLPSSSEMKSEAESAALLEKMKAGRPIYSPLDEGDLTEQADALLEGKTIYSCCLPRRKAVGAADETSHADNARD